jgi:hypothetical protein
MKEEDFLKMKQLGKADTILLKPEVGNFSMNS